jgi:hypothetical protein
MDAVVAQVGPVREKLDLLMAMAAKQADGHIEEEM